MTLTNKCQKSTPVLELELIKQLDIDSLVTGLCVRYNSDKHIIVINNSDIAKANEHIQSLA